MREEAAETGAGATTGAFAVVTTLFFAWGFVTSNNDPLVAALKSIYRLSTLEAQVTQFAFFAGYGLFSLPAAALLGRLGASRSILAALALMAAACLLVPLASRFQTYELVLVALFLLASGITTLQVAANPLAASLGSAERSHFRLLLAQSFNSLGVVIGVHIGSKLMLSGEIFQKGFIITTAAQRATGLAAVDRSFLVIAALMLVLLALIFAFRRQIEAASPAFRTSASPLAALASRWATWGALAIFVYVGAEVAIGSQMILFLNRPEVLNLSLEDAGWYLGWVYWFGALVGRFVGSALLTRFPAARLLLLCAGLAAAMCAVAFGVPGPVGAYAALSIGLFNSIMFPVIFTLTLERSSAPVSATSGLLCLAIVGGGFLPLLMGKVADVASVPASFAVPAVAYLGIVAFALAAARVRAAGPVDAAPAMAH